MDKDSFLKIEQSNMRRRSFLDHILNSRNLFTILSRRRSAPNYDIPSICINEPIDSFSSQSVSLAQLPQGPISNNAPENQLEDNKLENIHRDKTKSVLSRQESVDEDEFSGRKSLNNNEEDIILKNLKKMEEGGSSNDVLGDKEKELKRGNIEFVKRMDESGFLFPCTDPFNLATGPTGESVNLNLRARRPRLFSHPNLSSPQMAHLLIPELQTAPILQQSNKFSLPGYFRRFSQQGLVTSESMVSLTNRALVSFIAEENYAGFQHLLESRRVVVDDRDENGATALMVAASRGKSNFVRSLIEHGADVNAEDLDNWTALLCAAREGHDEIVQELLDHGATVDHRDMGGWTPLMWACYKGRSRAARILMEKGCADVNAYGNYTVTCVAWAAGRGYAEIVRDLVQHGAKVNTGDKYGTTPLIWACRKGYVEIVDMLLHGEANVDACGMTSWTPLLVASSGNHVDVVKLLLDHKPNVNGMDKDGCSALTIACKEGFHEIAVTLLNFGAYINVSDRGGSTNLIHAAKGGHRSIVDALLKRHADVNVQGKDRKTALYWAVEKSHVSVVKLILGANPDLEISTKDGDTALLKAVRNRNVEIVALLLEKRAKVSAGDKNGDNCLHIAMRARSKQIVELLLRNPVHSQLLYRPNRCGETPYNIDRSSPKPILPQIFGHRGLNTQEDGENLLGYSLYSSALADMLSDPTLNMPITVGLFARWGSGKSFLLNKLREEMQSFARQWFNPVFNFSLLIFIVTFCLSSVLGVVGALAVPEYRWIIGGSITLGFLALVHTFLFFIWFGSKRAKYEWSAANRMSRYLATKFDSLKLIFQVIFCHPPGSKFSDQVQAQPINFYFTEQSKISSTTGGENSVVQMLGSLYNCLEKDYGTLSTRLYRAFKPRAISATSDWRWRKLCCVPYCIIFLLCFICSLVGIVVLVFSFSSLGGEETQEHFNSIAFKVTMYSCILFVGLLLVANLYTIGQVFKTIFFSHRRHLMRAVSKMYALKAEGFLNSLKSEVNLITDMVKCLDAFTGKQSRMVVIVDGLDSGEQEKVLQVLDAVHILFSDAKAPFIILLAIDPHIIAKGIELNVNAVLNESNIGGHEYLRNLVHLPFFLQNAALRKVKQVKMLESTMKAKKLEDDPGPQIILSTRRASVESAFGVAMPLERFEKPVKKGRRLGLKSSESIASSLGSNLNKVVSGPTDLKKILLGDDYFSDINPKSMRRLMNIIHVTGRLLKAFNIDFNWYHLTTWVNVTEQWPYRLSWIILYSEQFQKEFDDSLSLKTVYERVRPFIPTSKEVDPNVVLDRDEKKLDVYLGLHKGSLLVSTMYVFLPFTISLDPQLRKDIQELYQPLEQIFKQGQIQMGGPAHPPASPFVQSAHLHNLRLRPNARGQMQFNNGPIPLQQFYANGPQPLYSQLPEHGFYQYPFPQNQIIPQMHLLEPDHVLQRELRNKKLSTLTVDGVCDILKGLTGHYSNLKQYEDGIKKNNICGRVLLSCDLNELKQIFSMSFGDWELFKSVVITLRDLDHTLDGPNCNVRESDKSVRINVTSPDRELGPSSSDGFAYKKHPKPNILEKQVTMEDQMIFGALELLNDEARDDAIKGDVSPPSTLSPINSEPEPGDDAPKSSRSNINDENETDVLYVMGTSLTLSTGLMSSVPNLKKESPSTTFLISNETLSSRHSPSHEVEPDRKMNEIVNKSQIVRSSESESVKNIEVLKHSDNVKGSESKERKISSGSPRKMSRNNRTSGHYERKGIIMNPKSPGLAFDSRKWNTSATPSQTSSDEEKETRALIGPNNSKSPEQQPSSSRQVHFPSSPSKRRSRPDANTNLSKIRSIFTRDSPNNNLNTNSEEGSLGSVTNYRAYRSPTPLPPFGSEEYYKVIKSDNPSPTTSNESEIGSSPEHLSSGENLFLPGPPDLPAESPFPRRLFRPIPGRTPGNLSASEHHNAVHHPPSHRSSLGKSSYNNSEPTLHVSPEGGGGGRRRSRNEEEEGGDNSLSLSSITAELNAEFERERRRGRERRGESGSSTESIHIQSSSQRIRSRRQNEDSQC